MNGQLTLKFETNESINLVAKVTGYEDKAFNVDFGEDSIVFENVVMDKVAVNAPNQPTTNKKSGGAVDPYLMILMLLMLFTHLRGQSLKARRMQ